MEIEIRCKRIFSGYGDIQEVCVQTSLCQRGGAAGGAVLRSGGEVILRVMEVLDGVRRAEIGRLCIVCPETAAA